MVRIGDKIKVGIRKGIVVNISKSTDKRYLILYISKGKTYSLLEGDDDYKVLGK